MRPPATLLLALLLLVPGLPTVGAEVGALDDDFTEREVMFVNGSVELAGTLMTPLGEGPHPGIVFLHGSGDHPRAGFRPYAEAFARLGVASLFFDKRGTAESGGSWITSSLDDLAGDGLAALELLRAEPGVDPDRVGFWGVSQAGWVATLAASRSGDVGFMILISGGGASPRASEMYSYRRAFDHVGLSQEERTEAERVLELYFHYLTTGEDRDDLVAAVDEGRDEAWYEAAPLGRILPSEENRANWRWVASYDPEPHMRELDMPMLLMFGQRDRNHPTELAVERWREALEEAGNDRVTLMVFPGAGHGIRIDGGQPDHRSKDFADGYAEVQLGWLWRHVLDPDQGS